MSLNQVCEILYSLFYGMSKLRNTKIFWNEGADHLFLPHIKLFKNNFLHYFWRKIHLRLYSINWSNLFVWLPLLLEMLCIMCIICFPVYDVIIFKINLSLSSSRFPTWPKKSGQKLEYRKNKKGFLDDIKNLKQKFLNKILLKQIKPTFLEEESLTSTGQSCFTYV